MADRPLRARALGPDYAWLWPVANNSRKLIKAGKCSEWDILKMRVVD